MPVYIAEQFYNRESEVQKIKAQICSSSAASHRIVNFFGMPGAGKSWLLHRLWEEYHPQIPCFLMTNDEANQGAQDALNTILKTIIEQLEQLRQDSQKRPENWTTAAMEDYFDRFLGDMEEIEKIKILLLLDNYDTWSRQLREHFEKSILRRLIGYNCTLTVVTSRAEVKFEFLSALQLSTEPQELGLFTPAILTKKYQHYQEIIPRLLLATGGLPVCVEHAVEYLQRHKITTLAQFIEEEATIVRQMYDEVIHKRLLDEIDSVLHETLRILALPRRFDLGVLQYILAELLPAPYRSYVNMEYVELLNELEYFAPWNGKNHGYAIPLVARQILFRYMQLFYPVQAQQINTMLRQYYADQRDVNLSPMQNLSEYLYHTLSGFQMEPSERPVNARFSDEVETCCKKYTSLFQVLAFKKTLEADAEIKDYITKGVWNVLDNQIRRLS